MLRIVTGLAAVMVGLAAAGVASGLYRGAHCTENPSLARSAATVTELPQVPVIDPVKHRLATAVKFEHGYYYPGKVHTWTVQHYDEQLSCTVYWCPVTHDWYFWSDRLGCYLPVVCWTPDGGSFDAPMKDREANGLE
jgi:hypothetical protein